MENKEQETVEQAAQREADARYNPNYDLECHHNTGFSEGFVAGANWQKAQGTKATGSGMSAIRAIKEYVRSLDSPDNEVYQQHNLLIMSCFSKAMEIIEAQGLFTREDMERFATFCKSKYDSLKHKNRKGQPSFNDQDLNSIFAIPGLFDEFMASNYPETRGSFFISRDETGTTVYKNGKRIDPPTNEA